MSTKTDLLVKPQVQIAHKQQSLELIPLEQLAEVFQKKHWGYRVAGKGVPIYEPIRIGNWTYTPSKLDCPLLHPQAAERGRIIENCNIPVLQWIYGEEDKPKPKIHPVQPIREVDVDWEEILKIAIFLAGGFLVYFLDEMANLRNEQVELAKRERRLQSERRSERSFGYTSALWCGDPALYCLLDDAEYTFHGKSTIVEVFRWFPD